MDNNILWDSHIGNKNLSFVITKCDFNEKNEVSYYHLDVLVETKVVISLKVEPNKLFSHKSMKTLFINKGLIYQATEKQHNELLSSAFSSNGENSLFTYSCRNKPPPAS